MRAVLVHVTDEELAHRRSIGLDRRDEMWEGVLHITPAPSLEHQRIVDELIMFLGRHLVASRRGTLRSGINVFSSVPSPVDYQIPDLTFVAAGRKHVLQEDGVPGGPDAVMEIRSPEDETYDKLPFYDALGTREVIVIDRDSKRPQIYRQAESCLAPQPDADGWLHAETMGMRLRAIDKQPPVLRIEDAIDASVCVEI